MRRYEAIRDELRAGSLRLQRLDAVQLIKHAFALRTAVQMRPDALGKEAVLLYLFAEPKQWPDCRPVMEADRARHRDEIEKFAKMVVGDEVSFVACSYREILDIWARSQNAPLQAHAHRVLAAFQP